MPLLEKNSTHSHLETHPDDSYLLRAQPSSTVMPSHTPYVNVQYRGAISPITLHRKKLSPVKPHTVLAATDQQRLLNLEPAVFKSKGVLGVAFALSGTSIPGAANHSQSTLRPPLPPPHNHHTLSHQSANSLNRNTLRGGRNPIHAPAPGTGDGPTTPESVQLQDSWVLNSNVPLETRSHKGVVKVLLTVPLKSFSECSVLFSSYGYNVLSRPDQNRNSKEEVNEGGYYQKKEMKHLLSLSLQAKEAVQVLQLEVRRSDSHRSCCPAGHPTVLLHRIKLKAHYKHKADSQGVSFVTALRCTGKIKFSRSPGLQSASVNSQSDRQEDT
ncbi:Teneurin-2 [Channa argus]|uniref:Teneurin-2 n=1 Tax=Channa argus TaxID=215402 RepID=A0A6G1PTL1_CHAAH|nr:Teneurin-2 [Channa argus]